MTQVTQTSQNPINAHACVCMGLTVFYPRCVTCVTRQEAETPDLIYEYQERAAILEYEAHLPGHESETRAASMVLTGGKNPGETRRGRSDPISSALLAIDPGAASLMVPFQDRRPQR